MLNRREFTTAGIAAALLGARPVSASDSPAHLDLTSAAGLVRRGEISPLALTEACLERIAALDPVLNSFITVTTEQALRTAKARTDELHNGRYRGPLHGIPLALKDNIDTAGSRTTAASAAMAQRVPDTDAEVVRRLVAAGAVIIGKLNMDECAYGLTSTGGHFGAVRNPWDPDHVAGGSSGGAAAAVAARLCFGAIGTDTGGSIRQPAAYCGVTGLKPTYGLVSTRGVMPLAWSLDHVGPIARSARDALLLLDAIAGYDPQDPGSDPRAHDLYHTYAGRVSSRYRLGRVDALFTGLDPDVERIVNSAVQVLESLGAGMASADLPEVPRLALMFVESHVHFGEMVEASPELFSAEFRMLVETGAQLSAARYARERQTLVMARRAAAGLFDRVDLLVAPTTPDLPMSIEQSLEPPADFGPPPSARTTTPFNVLGLPTISIPCGLSPDGLPVGLQISGPPGGDTRVLALARAFQEHTDWHERQPPTPGP